MRTPGLGYQQALTEAGLPLFPNLVVEGRFDEPSGQAAVETLLTRGESFSAVFAANDQMAFGAMLSLYLHGLRVPDDVSVVGFDDVRMSAYTTPPLTTVCIPTHELGQSAGTDGARPSGRARAAPGDIRDQVGDSAIGTRSRSWRPTRR